MIVPVILAGGSGTRLWPLSRELFPKQLLPLLGNDTMLQSTVLRLSEMEEVEEFIVICNENHRFLVAEQLRAVESKPATIILEPVGRNTAPAVAIAALKVLAAGGDPNIVILPADHHIDDIASFQEALRAAADFSSEGYLVTFGIIPHSPQTGYGYIRKGEKISSSSNNVCALRIEKFIEKPSIERARELVASECYFWNSGMFMFQASRVLQELERFAPSIVQSCRQAFETGLRDLDFYRLDAGAFEACPADSIDYAVMEKTENGIVLPLHCTWDDIGSWDALWRINDRDGSENVMVGDVLVHDVENSYIHATSRLVAAVGIRNHVIVETPDAVLISPRDRVQDVKILVNKLKAENREEALSHRKVYRPWGAYEPIDVDRRFQVKRITVKPGAKLSLQRHFHRAEHWVVVRGTALVTRDDEEILLKEDESIYIPLGVRHRLENPGRIPLEIVEVQSGSYLGEDDIVRFDDIYGREH